MKPSQISTSIALSSLLFLNTNARPWTNTDGKTIQADFVKLAGDQVILKISGKQLSYPLAKLSQADRDFAATATPAAPSTSSSPTSSFSHPHSTTKGAAIAPVTPSDRPKSTKTGLQSNIPIDAYLYPTIKDYEKNRDFKKTTEQWNKDYTFNKDAKPWNERDPKTDTCNIYVPASYTGSEPYGLCLFINPGDNGDIPAQFHSILDQKKLIGVSANKTKNGEHYSRRVSLSMDALSIAERLYQTDPNRRLVCGFSGGGHMAFATCALFPNYFQGTISCAAQSYLNGHFGALKADDFKSPDRRHLKWIVISGNSDFNYQEILKTSKEWEKNRLPYTFIDVPGQGHSYCNTEKFLQGVNIIGL